MLFWSNRHSAAPRFYFYRFPGRYFCRIFIIHCLCAESASNEFKVTANKVVETKGNGHLRGADESPSVSAVPPHLFFISVSLCRGERDARFPSRHGLPLPSTSHSAKSSCSARSRSCLCLPLFVSLSAHVPDCGRLIRTKSLFFSRFLAPLPC